MGNKEDSPDLQHPVGDNLPHVGLDLDLRVLKVVGGGDVELLNV